MHDLVKHNISLNLKFGLSPGNWIGIYDFFWWYAFYFSPIVVKPLSCMDYPEIRIFHVQLPEVTTVDSAGGERRKEGNEKTWGWNSKLIWPAPISPMLHCALVNFPIRSCIWRDCFLLLTFSFFYLLGCLVSVLGCHRCHDFPHLPWISNNSIFRLFQAFESLGDISANQWQWVAIATDVTACIASV